MERLSVEKSRRIIIAAAIYYGLPNATASLSQDSLKSVRLLVSYTETEAQMG